MRKCTFGLGKKEDSLLSPFKGEGACPTTVRMVQMRDLIKIYTMIYSTNIFWGLGTKILLFLTIRFTQTKLNSDVCFMFDFMFMWLV